MTGGHKAEGLYRDWDETHSPYSGIPLQISAARTWEGVALFNFELTPVPELTEVSAPTLDFHALVLHVAGPMNLQRKLEIYTKKALTVPGELCLHPAQISGAYAWDGVGTIAFVMPSVAFMARLAADLTRRDAERIGLRDDFNFRDGLLKHLYLNLLGEARSGAAGQLLHDHGFALTAGQSSKPPGDALG